VKGHVRRSTVNALAKLLGTVVFVEEVVSDFLKISQMAVEEGASDCQEIGVTRVLNLDHTPRILSGSYFATIDLDKVLGANNGERHQSPELGVLLHGVLIILLDIVREVVDRNAIVLNILHDQLLGLSEFGGSEGVGLADNRDHVDTRGQALHQFNVELAQTMASRRDEIKQDVDTVVPETGVSLDS
jgi:hypothetical protein